MLRISDLQKGFDDSIYKEIPKSLEDCVIAWKKTYFDYAKKGNTEFAIITGISEIGENIFFDGLKKIFEKTFDKISDFQTEMNDLFFEFWINPVNVIFSPLTVIVTDVGYLSFSNLVMTDDKDIALFNISNALDTYTRTIGLLNPITGQKGNLS